MISGTQGDVSLDIESFCCKDPLELSYSLFLPASVRDMEGWGMTAHHLKATKHVFHVFRYKDNLCHGNKHFSGKMLKKKL